MNLSYMLAAFLRPGEFTDSDSPAVQEYALNITRCTANDREKATLLYYSVRDRFKYNPFKIDLRPQALKASALLERDFGYCVEKANLLAALGRAVGIPTRLGYAKVRNHLGTVRLESILKSNVLVFHGYTLFYLQDRWVKCTPAFNKELCIKLNVSPLEFDGKNDSLFQQYTRDKTKFMEYLFDYGEFSDLPYTMYIEELKTHYPHMFKTKVLSGKEYFILPQE